MFSRFHVKQIFIWFSKRRYVILFEYRLCYDNSVKNNIIVTTFIMAFRHYCVVISLSGFRFVFRIHGRVLFRNAFTRWNSIVWKSLFITRLICSWISVNTNVRVFRRFCSFGRCIRPPFQRAVDFSNTLPTKEPYACTYGGYLSYLLKISYTQYRQYRFIWTKSRYSCIQGRWIFDTCCKTVDGVPERRIV